MLSKYLPWDFLHKFPQTIGAKSTGVHAFLVDEPFLERVLFDLLPKKEMEFVLYSGNEVTREFIEENFVNLSFFSNNNPIMVMNAETTPASSLDFINEADIDWSTRLLVMFFTKTSKAWTEFAKSKKVQAIEITPPRFWEGPKLWQFCQKVREVHLPGDVSRFALENLEHNFESFFWFIDTIKLNFPQGPLDLKMIKDLVAKERWDFFELADLFGKNPKLFFQEILKKDIDYDWMRSMSAFMQTHLLKILFPDEIRAKDKFSKYDEAILDLSERLNREVVKSYMTFFSELEILSKMSDPLLVNKLRLELLRP